MKSLLCLVIFASSLAIASGEGFKVLSIENNDFYQHFKIVEGDEILEINTKKVDSLSDVMSYMDDYKKVNEIVVMRNGKKKTYKRLAK